MSSNIDVLSKNIYSEDKNDGYGHTIIVCQPLDSIKPSKSLKEEVISHIISVVDESLRISRKYNNKRSVVHVYMNGCFLTHYSANFYKRLMKQLDTTFEDTLKIAYVYDAPQIARTAWDVLKLFVDIETRKKIHMV